MYSGWRLLSILFIGVLIGEHRVRIRKKREEFAPMGRIGPPMEKMPLLSQRHRAHGARQSLPGPQRWLNTKPFDFVQGRAAKEALARLWREGPASRRLRRASSIQTTHGAGQGASWPATVIR
jgi:hypothetical protein